VTIVAAACAFVDEMVESGSFLRTQVSACDYGVLIGNACAIVVQPGTSTVDEYALGQLQRTWRMRAECYVRDTGDVVETMARVWHMHDAVDGAISSGSTLQTPHRMARATTFDRPPDVFAEFGGNDYIPIFVTVEVQEEC